MSSLHSPLRRGFLAASALLALGPVCAQPASYPVKPIRWLVGYPPGGGTDTIARIVSASMAQTLGQTIFVDNKPGASANIAGGELARAPGDGYTVMSADNGLLVFNPVMYKRMGFAPAKELRPVGLLARLHLVIVVQPDHPANTYQDLVAWIKAQNAPVQYAASSIGSPLHLAMERLASESKLNLVQVPYKGASPAVADFLAKMVSVMCIDYSSAAQYVKTGKMKAIAVTSAKRIAALPKVSTVIESGGPAGFEAYAWQGVVVPSSTPDAVVAQLNKALTGALAQPAVLGKLDELGIEATPSSTTDFSTFWTHETKTWQPLIQKMSLTLD